MAATLLDQPAAAEMSPTEPAKTQVHRPEAAEALAAAATAGDEAEEQKRTKDAAKPAQAEQELVASMSEMPANQTVLSRARLIEVQDENASSPPLEPVVISTAAPTGAVSSPPAEEQTAKVQELEQKLQQLETKEREWLQLQSLMTQGISAMVQKEENLRQEIAQRDAAFKTKQGLLTGQLEAQLKESCPKVPVCYARFGRLGSFRQPSGVHTG